MERMWETVKKGLFGFVCIVGSLVIAATICTAADYKSKDFPPAETIRKGLATYIAKDNYEIGNPVGKHKVSESAYSVYVKLTSKHDQKDSVEEVTIIKLDSDLWIFKWKDYKHILQK